MTRYDIGKQIKTPPNNKAHREQPTGNVPKANVMGSGKMNGGMAGAKGAMAHTPGCGAKGKGYVGCK